MTEVKTYVHTTSQMFSVGEAYEYVIERLNAAIRVGDPVIGLTKIIRSQSTSVSVPTITKRTIAIVASHIVAVEEKVKSI